MANVGELNRPSVIVFNPNYIPNENRESVIVLNQNEQQNNENLNNYVNDEDSRNSFDGYFDNIENDTVSNPRVELTPEEYLNLIRANYEILVEKNQQSKIDQNFFST